jgi:hypothetical protein
VDLTEVSVPLVSLTTGGFTVGQTAIKVASSKVVKHERACSENQHAFISFAFDTFGFLTLEAVDILKRVQRVMHNNMVSPRSLDVVFKMIDFAIQKELAAQLIIRLPTLKCNYPIYININCLFNFGHIHNCICCLLFLYCLLNFTIKHLSHSSI